MARKYTMTEKAKAQKAEHFAKLAKQNKEMSARMNEYKEQTEAVKRAAMNAPRYTNPVLMAYKLADYMHTCDTSTLDGKRIPYTKQGFNVALGITVFDDYKSGKFDYVITANRNGEGIRNTVETPFHIWDVPSNLLDRVICLTGIPYNDESDRLEIQDMESRLFFSEVCESAWTMFLAQREIDLYIKGRVSDIFVGKNYLGMKDEQTVTSRREICSPEQAKELMKEFREAYQLTD